MPTPPASRSTKHTNVNSGSEHPVSTPHSEQETPTSRRNTVFTQTTTRSWTSTSTQTDTVLDLNTSTSTSTSQKNDAPRKSTRQKRRDYLHSQTSQTLLLRKPRPSSKHENYEENKHVMHSTLKHAPNTLTVTSLWRAYPQSSIQHWEPSHHI